MQLIGRSSTPALGAVSRLIAGVTVWVATFVLLPSLAVAAEPQRDVHYSYDLMGRQLTAKFDSPGGTDGITNTYNGFGDLLTSQLRMGTFNKTLTSIYDGAGRRTRLTHPDNQAFTYTYDDLSRPSGVYQGTGTTTPLANFSYANNGLLSARSEGSGNSGAAYGWDDIDRLTSQSDTFRFNVNNVAWGFTYNPASQIVTETRDNDAYAQAVAEGSTAYAVNGLNQYTSVGGAAHSYDANGNLTNDGTTAYTYDVENRLVRATAGSTVTNLVYDPLGRLFQVDRGTSGTTTRFLHDGDALALEFNSSNAVTNRFVHGSNAAADDPLFWYSGSGLTNKRWLHADHLGSIVAWTNSSGGSPTINRYDEYGVPAATNSGRFQYTGQAWLPEVDLYYYKARFYSPGLGRFMQTDPVGYEDNLNLYAYVGNDPVNINDPTGSVSSETQGTELANTCSRLGGSACSGNYEGSGAGDLDGTQLAQRGPGRRPPSVRSPGTNARMAPFGFRGQRLADPRSHVRIHIGQTRGQLYRRLTNEKDIPAASSFKSEAVARIALAGARRENQEAINRWAAGNNPLPLQVRYHSRQSLGEVWHRGSPAPEASYDAVFILRPIQHGPLFGSTYDYYVQTGYLE